MKILLIIAFICGFVMPSEAITSPNSVISSSTSGAVTCPGCGIFSTASAYDNNNATYAHIDVSPSVLTGYGQVVYGFASPIPQYDLITIRLQIEGASIMDGNVSAIASKFFEIQLQNNSGTGLYTYNNSNQTGVELVDSATNLFEIKIINRSSATQRISVRVGSLDDVVGEDMHIVELYYEDEIYEFVERDITVGSGYSGGNILFCPGCSIDDPDYAVETYDPNSEYATLTIPLSASIGNNYLHVDYDWTDSSFSGTDNHVYVVFEKMNYVNAATEVFDSNQISFIITYTDATTESFSSSNGLITVTLLNDGDGRVLAELDANDSKRFNGISVRVFEPQAGVDNVIRIYNAYTKFEYPVLLSETTIQANSTALNEEALIKWEVSNQDEVDKYKISGSTDGINFNELISVNMSENNKYSHIDRSPEIGINYYKVEAFNIDGVKIGSDLTSIYLAEKLIDIKMVFDAITNEWCFKVPENEQVINAHIFSINGQKLFSTSEKDSPGEMRIRGNQIPQGSSFIMVQTTKRTSAFKFYRY